VAHEVEQKEKELEGVQTITSIAELPFPKQTSISIVTPPKVSNNLLSRLGSSMFIVSFSRSLSGFWNKPRICPYLPSGSSQALKMKPL